MVGSLEAFPHINGQNNKLYRMNLFIMIIIPAFFIIKDYPLYFLEDWKYFN